MYRLLNCLQSYTFYYCQLCIKILRLFTKLVCAKGKYEGFVPADNLLKIVVHFHTRHDFLRKNRYM